MFITWSRSRPCWIRARFCLEGRSWSWGRRFRWRWTTGEAFRDEPVSSRNFSSSRPRSPRKSVWQISLVKSYYVIFLYYVFLTRKISGRLHCWAWILLSNAVVRFNKKSISKKFFSNWNESQRSTICITKNSGPSVSIFYNLKYSLPKIFPKNLPNDLVPYQQTKYFKFYQKYCYNFLIVLNKINVLTWSSILHLNNSPFSSSAESMESSPPLTVTPATTLVISSWIEQIKKLLIS